jgi:single-strand DNA-binding protein
MIMSQQYQQTNQPLAKGRVCYASEYYPSGQRDTQNKPIMKARYATLGKATLWPSEQPHLPPQVSIDLDSMPIGSTGTIKLTIFWDEPTQNQQAPTPQHQQAHAPQPQSYGSWGNPPPQPAPQR